LHFDGVGSHLGEKLAHIGKIYPYDGIFDIFRCPKARSLSLFMNLNAGNSIGSI